MFLRKNRRKSHVKQIFALFLCWCKKTSAVTATKDEGEEKTSAMTAAKRRRDLRRDRREAAITTKKDRRPWEVALVAGLRGAAPSALSGPLHPLARSLLRVVFSHTHFYAELYCEFHGEFIIIIVDHGKSDGGGERVGPPRARLRLALACALVARCSG